MQHRVPLIVYIVVIKQQVSISYLAKAKTQSLEKKIWIFYNWKAGKGLPDTYTLLTNNSSKPRSLVTFIQQNSRTFYRVISQFDHLDKHALPSRLSLCSLGIKNSIPFPSGETHVQDFSSRWYYWHGWLNNYKLETCYSAKEDAALFQYNWHPM